MNAAKCILIIKEQDTEMTGMQTSWSAFGLTHQRKTVEIINLCSRAVLVLEFLEAGIHAYRSVL